MNIRVMGHILRTNSIAEHGDKFVENAAVYEL